MATPQSQELLGIDTRVGIQVIVVAVVSGIIAALVDRVVDLPTETLAFMFGWGLIAALNGPVYYFFKGSKESVAATVMSAVSGFLALLVWWIVIKLVGDGTTSHFVAEELNLLEMLVSGVVVGLISYGWFVLMRRLPGATQR